MPRPLGSRNLREMEISEIVARLHKMVNAGIGIMEASRRVGAKMELSSDIVYQVWRRMLPTTDLATRYIKASAFRLAARVVRKASAEQAISVLSRPNIGVLDPASTGGGGGGGHQFMIGVAVDSLGGVKVGIQGGPIGQLPEASSSPVPSSEPKTGETGPGVYEDDEEDSLPDEETVFRRGRGPNRYQAPVIEPIPKEEGRFFGQRTSTRSALAKVEYREEVKRVRKDRERIKQRMREMAEEMKGK